MANFDELKQKARETVGVIADVSAELYKIAEEKARILTKTTKLNAEIVRERANIRKLYGELGKMYYKLYKDAPADALAQGCLEVTASINRIVANKKLIDELKSSGIITEEDIEVEIVTGEEPADGDGADGE